MAESLSVLDIDDQHCDLCVAGWTGLHHFFKALRPPIVLQPSLRIMAERVGFEPTVRFPVRSLSRRVLSTAQSPLRGCCSLNRSRALRCSASQGRTVGARQQGGAFEERRDFLLFLQYYILQEDQAWTISHLQSLRALHI